MWRKRERGRSQGGHSHSSLGQLDEWVYQGMERVGRRRLGAARRRVQGWRVKPDGGVQEVAEYEDTEFVEQTR